MKALRALALSCHPVPTVAVTMLTVGLLALAGATAPRLILAATAMLATQLSIGWSNDAIDVHRDAQVARPDKPLARGELSRAVVLDAALSAVVIALGLGFALGSHEGVLMAVGIACGWAYNLGLKAVLLSPLPYAVAFGILPSIATWATRPGHWPPVWATVAGALFGMAAHVTNVLPDLVDDIRLGVRGLPQRIGLRASALSGPLLLAAASVVILVGGAHGASRDLGLGVALICSAVALALGTRAPASRRYFLGVIVVVFADLAFFALAGSRL